MTLEDAAREVEAYLDDLTDFGVLDKHPALPILQSLRAALSENEKRENEEKPR